MRAIACVLQGLLALLKPDDMHEFGIFAVDQLHGLPINLEGQTVELQACEVSEHVAEDVCFVGSQGCFSGVKLPSLEGEQDLPDALDGALIAVFLSLDADSLELQLLEHLRGKAVGASSVDDGGKAVGDVLHELLLGDFSQEEVAPQEEGVEANDVEHVVDHQSAVLCGYRFAEVEQELEVVGEQIPTLLAVAAGNIAQAIARPIELPTVEFRVYVGLDRRPDRLLEQPQVGSAQGPNQKLIIACLLFVLSRPQ